MHASTLLALIAVAVAGSLGAQPVYVYALNEHGRVAINGTPFHNLPASFDPGDPQERRDNKRWTDQVVLGSDHYHLRRDGRITRNGLTLRRAPRNDGRWVRLAVAADGTTWCLGRRGRIARNESWLYALPSVPSEDRVFDEFVEHQGVLHSLRRDGLVYVDGQTAPTWVLPGTATGPTSGQRWRDLAIDRASGALYALRQDGRLYRLTAANAPFGELVADLPAPGARQQFRAVAIDANGAWTALREDGVVFREASGTTPVVDYPGAGRFEDDDFHALAVLGGSFFALRWDGAVFQDLGLEPLTNARGTRYVRLAVSDALPDTSALREFPTRVARANVAASVGDTVRVPLWATDVDDARETLTVDVLELPPGAAFDPQTFLLTWPAATAGRHRFVATVADDRRARRVTIPVRIGPRSTAGNAPPAFPRLGTLQVFRGRAFALVHEAYDPDGDPVVITGIDLPAWLTYDAGTGTLQGTPPLDQDRPLRVTLEADDGRGGVTRSRLRLRFADAFHFGTD